MENSPAYPKKDLRGEKYKTMYKREKGRNVKKKGKGFVAEECDLSDTSTSASDSDNAATNMSFMAILAEEALPATKVLSYTSSEEIKLKRVFNFSDFDEFEKLHALDRFTIDLYNAKVANKKMDQQIENLTNDLKEYLIKLEDFNRIKYEVLDQNIVNDHLNQESVEVLTKLEKAKKNTLHVWSKASINDIVKNQIPQQVKTEFLYGAESNPPVCNEEN